MNLLHRAPPVTMNTRKIDQALMKKYGLYVPYAKQMLIGAWQRH